MSKETDEIAQMVLEKAKAQFENGKVKKSKSLTPQQHSQWSAAFLVAAIICTAIVFGQGDAAKAVAMIFAFICGAMCAAHGARAKQ